jgi:hypothetical protein
MRECGRWIHSLCHCQYKFMFKIKDVVYSRRMLEGNWWILSPCGHSICVVNLSPSTVVYIMNQTVIPCHRFMLVKLLYTCI